jgi:hypothetical protein
VQDYFHRRAQPGDRLEAFEQRVKSSIDDETQWLASPLEKSHHVPDIRRTGSANPNFLPDLGAAASGAFFVSNFS